MAPLVVALASLIPVATFVRAARGIAIGAACAIAMAGCATPGAILAPYTERPAGCAAIAAEMWALAESDAPRYALRGVARGLPTAVGVASAAGALPTGWVWAPLVAAFAPLIPIGTHEQRIAYLAYWHAYEHCPPLETR